MKFISNTVGLMAVLCVIDSANAALQQYGTQRSGRTDSRVSVQVSPTMAAARRLPTMKYVGATTTTTSGTTSSSSSSLMTEMECVDAYSECIRASEVCGPDFEECTTNELFYAKKPQCNSVLLQCTSAGINTLFGTTSMDNLAAKNANEEYVYPTPASILGQYVEAGAINNRLDTSSCVKRYTSCLKKDNVCGETFELCTTNSEFKKQKIYCESTLARCQDEGKTELFGRTDTSQQPTATSRLGVAIAEGAELAAVNAVSTCYKVADQCLLSACKANPYRCIVNSNKKVIDEVDNVNNNNQVAPIASAQNDEVSVDTTLTATDVSKYLRSSCAETIGGNKYCYMTANEGKIPTASQITDEDERSNVFAEVYATRMNTSMRDRIKKVADEFDTRAKNACSDAIMSCAMRSCGGGLGSACYFKVFGDGKACNKGAASTTSTTSCTINGNSTYNEIKTACEAIVNTDANCQYAAASVSTGASFDYSYAVDTAFKKLFPENSATGSDPIGVISRLNASLAQNYNAAAIEQMAKQCKNTAVSCIRSLCGNDFVNCYRSRTDVLTDTYNTAGNKQSQPYTETVSDGNSMSSTSTITYDSSAFDKSMNKVGGVLDFTIVRGLCVNTVKDAAVCDEHLKIQAIKNYTNENGAAGWGNANSVRDAWVGAVQSGYSARVLRDDEAILIGCRASDSKGGLCDTNVVAECDTVDANGCIYDTEAYQPQNEYQLSMAANTLFQEVMGDLELEAQAKYNAKLTREQRMCVDGNNGGIMGRKDISSTYQWVKLRSNRVPKNYSVNGLKSNEFVASNDLYGSFCRARVTVQSDDPDIQRYLQEKNNSKNWTSAYFAVGDVFTCGSWIPQEDLEKIAITVACKKGKANGTIDASFDCGNISNADDLELTSGQKWGVAGLSILGAVGGGAITDVLQTKTGLGGLLGTNGTKIDDCKKEIASEEIEWSSGTSAEAMNLCRDHDDKMLAGYRMATAGTSIIRKNSSSKSIVRKKVEKIGDFNSNGCDAGLLSAEEAKTNNCSYKVSCEQINNHYDSITDYCGETSGWARAGVDVLGAGLVGTAAGITSAQLMKANNRTKFNEAQQQFMNNVGNHIYCFIGADEAGTYGDLIEISVD